MGQEGGVRHLRRGRPRAALAGALQAELDEACEPLVWRKNVFGSTGTRIGALLEKAPEFGLRSSRAYPRRFGGE